MAFVALGAKWGTAGTIRDFVTPMITAEIGLLGAVTGFYFATHEHGEGLPPVKSAQESTEVD